MDIAEKSLTLHKKTVGKIALAVKTPINSREDLSLAYTPGVAAVSRKIADNPEAVWEYTSRGNWVAVVSDGTAVLGLGDIGAGGALPVMEGKAVLFKEFAGVDAFPICLDTKDPDEIIETVVRIAPSFAGINLEDISAPRCFYVEEELKKRLSIPVFHDDQHGTAIVVLAGLLNASKVRGSELKNMRITISGVGAAGVAITKMLLSQGIEDIVLVDSHGIVSEKRSDLNPVKEKLAKQTNPNLISGGLTEAVRNRDVFIGVSKGGLMTKELVKSMADKPIIFALANPDPEIMPEEAKKAGAYIVASGRSDYPNQVNNVLAFPGLFRGTFDAKAKEITQEMKVAAAYALADLVSKPTTDEILPSPLDKDVAKQVAKAVRDAVVS